MVFFQALVSYVARSAGKILQALFGWAVQAIFGETKKNERTFLSAVIAAAAFWPLLLAGIAAPKIAAAVLAFIPITRKVPSSAVRGVWIALALAVPFLVGFVVTRRERHGTGGGRRGGILRGFPITTALAGAFLVIAVAAPVRRIAAIARGRRDEHVPFIVDLGQYHAVAKIILAALDRAGLGVAHTRPPWSMRLPSRILGKVAPGTFRGHIPERLEYFRGMELEVAVHPNGVTLQGSERVVARAHGFIAETITRTDALQTTDPRAQELEKAVKDVWRVRDQTPAHARSPVLSASVDALARELAELPVSYDEWETLYRELLQLARAVGAQGQLLEKQESGKEVTMHDNRADPRLAHTSTADLIGLISREVKTLVRQEIDLARVEIKGDMKAELSTVKGVGAGFLLAWSGIGLLLVAAAFAVAQGLDWPPWLAALSLGGVLLAGGVGAALAGWARRVRKPLEVTRRTLQEDVRWARNRVA